MPAHFRQVLRHGTTGFCAVPQCLDPLFEDLGDRQAIAMLALVGQ
ncbi:hypothetical protein [Arthrobacter crystallopoietes]|nr:hypothetical protein [Arthrobacter crystallopoietes]